MQKIIGNGLNSIRLPKDSGGATVTWTSNKSDIIDSEGNVTHKDGTGYDEVVLTAKITKGEAFDKKIFTVKVAQKNKVLSPEEILDSVTISVNYDKNKYEDQDVLMQELKPEEGKDVTIEYTSSNDEKHLKYDATTKKITIHRDIIDVTAQLSVKLTYKGEEKPKQIPVFIERIPEFIQVDHGYTTTVAFDGTTLTKTVSSEPDNNNSKFTYTVDTKNETVTVSKTHTFRNGKFLDKEEALNASIEQILKVISDIKKAYDQPNLENFRVLFNDGGMNFKNDDELIDHILKDKNIRKHFDGMTEASTKEEFKALAEDKKIAGIKNYCEEMLKEAAAYNNISTALPFHQMLRKLEAIAIADVRKEIPKQFFTNIKYKYKVSSESDKTKYPNGVWFEAEYIYDENRSWYENSNYGQWPNIWQSGNDEGELEVDSNRYYGKFNSDYTEFTYSQKRDSGTSQWESESGKWTFEKPVVDTDGNVRMKVRKSGSTEEITLNFTPNKL